MRSGPATEVGDGRGCVFLVHFVRPCFTQDRTTSADALADCFLSMCFWCVRPVTALGRTAF